MSAWVSVNHGERQFSGGALEFRVDGSPLKLSATNEWRDALRAISSTPKRPSVQP